MVVEAKAALGLAVLVAVGGCRVKESGSDSDSVTGSGSDSVAVADSDSDSDSDSEIHWGGTVEWVSWERGLQVARQEDRSILLLVYADWCPRCRELAPVFARPDVAAAAGRLVMVRQNGDARPSWLRERFGEIGEYVPRVLFLRPDGSLREDVVSGHPRYPYFYSPHVTHRLIANMARAAGG
ncbi:MAG: thioredoxin family protein [Myxococcales bacterium]|jgi:hypothetical protein